MTDTHNIKAYPSASDRILADERVAASRFVEDGVWVADDSAPLREFRPPTAWRRFKKWAGFPEYEDLPRCGGCGEGVTIGEYPIYPWVCRKPVTPGCWR